MAARAAHQQPFVARVGLEHDTDNLAHFWRLSTIHGHSAKLDKLRIPHCLAFEQSQR
jgi:hypothetical protein